MNLSIEKLNKIGEEAGKEATTQVEMLGLIVNKAYQYGAKEVLDNIRAEIERIDSTYYRSVNGIDMIDCADDIKRNVLQIINKYRTEVEDK